MSEKPRKLRIATIYCFPNGNVAVCDQFGQQMPEFQGMSDKVRDKIDAQIATQDQKPVVYGDYH